MPRIVPIQLLTCLKVLLDDNGGILSAGEVIRIAGLMTKYSKKLVSKCIYVQILKCTKTELLGEFMGAGGWSLVYTWLNDAIRAMNWPLVQEILELLLLCPVDVHRLKINSAPKLVKGLCKGGGNEGVRILAKRLVEQWLKVVTENPEATLPSSNMTPTVASVKTPTVSSVKTPTVPSVKTSTVASVVQDNTISSNVQQQPQQSPLVNTTTNQISQTVLAKHKQEEQKTTTDQHNKTMSTTKTIRKVQDFEEEEKEEEEEQEEDVDEEEDSRETTEQHDQDPLGGVDPAPTVSNYTLTPAQKKASESGLVYKFIIKDGQSILAQVPPKTSQSAIADQASVDDEEEEGGESTEVNEEDAGENEESQITEETTQVDNAIEADENSSSIDKPEKDDSNSSSEDKAKIEDVKKSEDKKPSDEKEKSDNHKDHKSSKNNERRNSNSSLDKEKIKDKESKSSKSSSSSSSSHRSSSSHKSSSSKSSSSSSKSKSSSSSSSHRSSSEKHKSEKERSSSSSSKDKDKDRERSSSSSSSSKHRSSSSKSSSSSSSSSKDKHKDKDKEKSSSSKSKDKLDQSDKEKSIQEKIVLSSPSSSSSSSSTLEKLSKLTKKSKEELGTGDIENSNKPTSITIPSKKASMSIEIRKDTEKAKTVKTYKSQFRSHGLTEEAPPPPSRKGLKKPSSTTPPGTVLPSSLPSSLKRTSPPPRDSPTEKKAKIDINNVTVAVEKPGSIKLIPPKKIQTLVETNIFSDALSAATGPKKITKRKRPNTQLVNGKECPSSPTSPEAPKVMPLKFYQDTLDESKTEESKSDKENDETSPKISNDESSASVDDKDVDDDDDIPLKKVKEDIEQKVAQEKKLDAGENSANVIEIKDEGADNKDENGSSPSRQQLEGEEDNDVPIERKPGPGCGPNGPPGVLMLHRRKGPKKKLKWHPQESLEQIRYFELDENERCNVTKTSFMDMKNMERFSERDALVMARRGLHQEDNMEPQTNWKPLIEVDDVPPHPEGNQSKQRKIQAERELTTLRALYFTHALIPDSPAEAEFEPVFNHDVPLIPLDDLTGNPDAVNDFTSMPWPEPRGSPKQGDNLMSGTGGLGSPVNMFGNTPPAVTNVPSNNKQSGAGNTFNPFVNPFVGNQGAKIPNVPPMQNSPQNQWQGPPNGVGGGPMSGPGPMSGNGPMMGNPFNANHGSPIMDMSGPGPMGPGPMMNNGPPQNFMNQFSPNFGGPPNNPFMGGPPGFNNGPNNFGPMGPNGPMMNGMGPGGPGPMMGNNCPPQMMNGVHNNRNNNRGNNGGGNWRSGGSNFQDNGGGGNNWRPAGPGPNNRGGGGNGNNGVCKAFMRGHCRLGNSCKYIHPNKSKRI